MIPEEPIVKFEPENRTGQLSEHWGKKPLSELPTSM